MSIEQQRPNTKRLNDVSRAVVEFTAGEFWLTPEFIKAIKPYLNEEGIPDPSVLEGIGVGVSIASRRIVQIQESGSDTEVRQKAAGVRVGSNRWTEMLIQWNNETDPHGTALLERGIILEREVQLKLAKLSATELSEQRHRTNAETIEAGQRLVVDYYRAIVEPQIN